MGCVSHENRFRIGGRTVEIASPPQEPCRLAALAEELREELWGLVEAQRAGELERTGATLVEDPPSLAALEVAAALKGLREVSSEWPFYGIDGAGGSGLLFHGSSDGPHPVTRPLLRNPSLAAAPLIEMLEEGTLTGVTFAGPDGTQPVTAGFLALDVLLGLSPQDSPGWTPGDCGDDGLGACVRPEFWFGPSARAGERRRARRAWTAAFESGSLPLRAEWWRDDAR